MTHRTKLRWPERAFLALGLVLIATWASAPLASRRYQSTETRKLEAARQVSVAAAPPPALRGPQAPGEATLLAQRGRALGRIEIPRLQIGAIVAEGTDAKTLSLAVGHVTSTALPGSPGNCALAGHRDSFFRGLGGVRVNDLIRVVTAESTYLYQVEWAVVVERRRVDLLRATPTRSLTLITCYPFAFVGRAPKRFVVRARQMEALSPSAIALRPTADGEVWTSPK